MASSTAIEPSTIVVFEEIGLRTVFARACNSSPKLCKQIFSVFEHVCQLSPDLVRWKAKRRTATSIPTRANLARG